jgi:hypothetical protein
LAEHQTLPLPLVPASSTLRWHLVSAESQTNHWNTCRWCGGVFGDIGQHELLCSDRPCVCGHPKSAHSYFAVDSGSACNRVDCPCPMWRPFVSEAGTVGYTAVANDSMAVVPSDWEDELCRCGHSRFLHRRNCENCVQCDCRGWGLAWVGVPEPPPTEDPPVWLL